MTANNHPTLSVIVPVYNVEKTLSKCVDSILGQPFRDLELILVDDGSPDRSGVMCDDMALRDSRIVVVHKSNGGLSSARNAGLDIARGEFISFVDSDDWVSSDFYAENIALLQDVKHLDMIITNIQKVYEHGKSPLLRTLPEGQCVGKDACAEVIFSASVASLCMVIYRRRVWEGLRFTEGILFEDSVISPDLVEKVNALHMSSRGIYYYRQREGSIMNSQWSVKKVRDYLNATLKVLEYLSENNISNYLYRYAGALFYSLRMSILGQLQKKEQEEYLIRFEVLPCPWSLIFRSSQLPLKHRIFLTVVKLLGIRCTNKILSLL